MALDIRSFSKSVSAIVHGIKQRWMRGTVLAVAVMLVVAIAAFTAISASSLYSTMRTGLETKAKTATDFFANYIMKTYADYYYSAYQYAESFDESDRLELQFIGTDNGRRVQTGLNRRHCGGYRGCGLCAAHRGDRALDRPPCRHRGAGHVRFRAHDLHRRTGHRHYAVCDKHEACRQTGLFPFPARLRHCGRDMLIDIIINLFFHPLFIEPVGEITRRAKRIATAATHPIIDFKRDGEWSSPSMR
jgi:hypothetical protein